ncbi:C4-dicarboxylate ABC transporter permease [Pokkaliibacter plantistimulans]|uniref:TRAP transporter large permease protein n=2 Tax=Pseudomonadota TaxID=1224 RepID=A0ABX5LR48_9GAMM|nr:TRAP transporter large permease subunit [Pokkaliibacter plantistimulans]PPC77562.1 C4-dicarboxylate ABC transporter permease [Pokkaliibacter plantistimulans]PXF29139.1 C4-dicarboxylate ABC transporter permease [Pokkaliibacter plantistimulans]
MNEALLTGVFLLALFFLLGSSVWVAFSLLGCAVVGMEMFTHRPVGESMAMTIWGVNSSWTLTSLPLFVWMGEILFRSKLSESLFKGLTPLMSRLPGGLLHVNVAGSAIFAAICGSSAATAVTVGKMSIPELRRRNYPEHMIVGTLAGAGTLGLLIPPSITLIIYGVTVNESIAKLFMAGVLPGLMLAALFMGYVAVVAWLKGDQSEREQMVYSLKDKLKGGVQLLPVFSLILVVIGSIYSGVATATESAVLGVAGSLLMAGLQGSLSWDSFRQSLMGAVRTSCMIAFILMGSSFLSLAMGFTGLPHNLAAIIASWHLSPLMLIVILTLFYIVMGCFLDGISSIVLTMAVIEPLVRQAGFDMIWFGVYLMLVVEMAQITPPVGFNLFVLQGMTGHDMGFIARAAFPMFLLMILAVVLLVWFPGIATALPAAM